MHTSGQLAHDLDPPYVAAHAVVVVGAHAVYIQTRDAGIAIAPFTTDADLALEPSRPARA